MTDPDPIAAVLDVTAVFEELGIRYIVGGSVASMFHGEARSTRDVDLIADLGDSDVQPLLEHLGNRYYADEQSIRDAIQLRRHFNLIDLSSHFKIDVFVPADEGFDAQKWNRRVQTVVDDERRVWITDAESIVLQKLLWFEAGGRSSDRQWRDVLGVLKTQGARIDQGFLRSWAAKLDVVDAVEQALRESGADHPSSPR